MTPVGVRARRAWVAGSFLAAAAVHVAAPAGPHSWYVLHLGRADALTSSTRTNDRGNQP